MIFSVFRQIALSNLCQLIFFIPLFFLSTCTKHCDQASAFTSSLTSEEKMDLEQFFHSLLFDNYGAYVLFGSKPLCELSIHDMDSPVADAAFQKFWEGLSEEEKEKIKEAKSRSQTQKNQVDLDKEMDLESSRYRGWLVFQKLMDQFKLTGFLFRAVPTLRPDAYDILFINIQKTAIVLAENYEIFKQAAKMDFHPLQVVFEAEDPHSLFWKNVMAMENHLAKGLLFGFGRKNSLFGHWAFSRGNLDMPNEKYKKEIESFLEGSTLHVSTDIVPKGNSSFNIPRFGTVEGDETAEKYERERSMIERKYHSTTSVLEVTLRQLFSSSSKSSRAG